MTKQELRKRVAGKVKNLSPVYCREADAAICRGVLQSEAYRQAKVLLCYVGSEREINTSALLHAALRDGKVLALPLCVEKGVMEARQIAGLGDLVSGKYGILAPKLTCPVVEPEALELVVVPCAAGNERGERLGYGGGDYDRYLPRVSCPTMLLCRRHLLTDEIPLEEHDLRMDYLVTEWGVVSCKGE